jgi:hypothetical protein
MADGRKMAQAISNIYKLKFELLNKIIEIIS